MGLSILAAYGLDLYSKEKSWRAIQYPLFFISGVVIVLWIFVLGMRHLSSTLPAVSSFGPFDKKTIDLYATVSFRNLILPSVFAVMVWFTLVFLRTKRILFVIAVFTVTLISSFYFASKILYFSDRQFEYPRTEPIAKLQELSGLNRVWTYGDAYVFRNILSYFSLYSPEGYDALFAHKYGELLHAIRTDGVITGDTFRTDANLNEMGQDELMDKNPSRLRIMSLLGVKYILEVKRSETKTFNLVEKRFPPELFSIAWENDMWRIWEYKKSFPRAFAVHNVVVASTREEVSAKLFDGTLDLTKTIILEQDKTLPTLPKDVVGHSTVNITSYEPMKVKLEAQMADDGYVFLSDTYFPGWNAYVDGQKQTIYEADYAFRAVFVPKGTHSLLFMYEPLSVQIGIGLCIFGSTAFIGMLWILYRQMHNHNGATKT